MPRMFFALATTVALIVAAAAAAVGQSSAPGPVTIEAGQIELTSPGVMTPNADRTTYLEQGREMTMEFEASDPRLSGEVACAGNRLVNRDGSFVEAETFVIVNDGGRWIGRSTGHVLAAPPPDIVVGIWPVSVGPDHRDVVALQGEGGYEGLSAVDLRRLVGRPAGGQRRHLRGRVAVGTGRGDRLTDRRRDQRAAHRREGARLPRGGPLRVTQGVRRGSTLWA